jgi:hypothetical protein
MPAIPKPSRSDLLVGVILGAILAVGVFLYLGNEPQAKGQAVSPSPPVAPPVAPPVSPAPPEAPVSPFGQLNAALSQAAAHGADPRSIAPGLKIDASGVQIPSAPVDVWFAVHVAGRTEFVRWSQVQGVIAARTHAARTPAAGSATCAIMHAGGHSVGVMRSANDLFPAMVNAANAAYLAAAQGAVLPTVVIDIDGGPLAP